MLSKIVIADASTWPGRPVAAWPSAHPPADTGPTAGFTPPRGRGIRRIAEDVPVACWLPVKQGLTPHGLRHSHKTWIGGRNLRHPPQERRLGHEVPGMRGLYTHVSQTMRTELTGALQSRWEDSLRPPSGRPPAPGSDHGGGGSRPAARRKRSDRPSPVRTSTTCSRWNCSTAAVQRRRRRTRRAGGTGHRAGRRRSAGAGSTHRPDRMTVLNHMIILSTRALTRASRATSASAFCPRPLTSSHRGVS